jgi:hypothetical protein
MNNTEQYLLNIALMVDRAGNALSFGSSRETISSRLGRAELHYGGVGKIPWYRPGRYIAAGLDAVWHDHCVNSIQWNDIPEIIQETIIDRYNLEQRS